MKKLIISILVLFALGYSFALDSSSIDTSCFLNKSQIKGEVQKTMKIQTNNDEFFAIQDSKLIGFKLNKKNKNEFIEYDIVKKSSGTQDKFLNDNNVDTISSFDNKDSEKYIIIDLKKEVKPGQFMFRLFYEAKYYYPSFLISSDNQNFYEIKESDIERHIFRFIKIKFKQIHNQPQFDNVVIKEINFLTPGKHEFLLNSETDSDIFFYSQYYCQVNDDYRKLIKQYNNLSRATQYSIDVNTSINVLDFETNPDYNDDIDGDGILNEKDNCPYSSNKSQTDVDGDLLGDVCDLDSDTKDYYLGDYDKDGISDNNDNCKYYYNPIQLDSNGDGIGDLCADDDKDGIIGKDDNCKDISNPKQEDVNVNGIGDACEFDFDKDSIFDSIDNCRTVINEDQKDNDKDGIGDVCDNCNLYNPQQLDKNNNKIGDKCEQVEKFNKDNDKDGDGILDMNDNCKDIANPKQNDFDKDGIGDACDNCKEIKNPDQKDKDENDVGDMCEDSDGDGILGYLDNCIYHSNSDQADQDNDKIGDVCEDEDGDNIVLLDDNCPYVYNADQKDIDNDGVGDKCDGDDNRYVESNKSFFIGFLVIVALIFGTAIYFVINKLK